MKAIEPNAEPNGMALAEYCQKHQTSGVRFNDFKLVYFDCPTCDHPRCAKIVIRRDMTKTNDWVKSSCNEIEVIRDCKKINTKAKTIGELAELLETV